VTARAGVQLATAALGATAVAVASAAGAGDPRAAASVRLVSLGRFESPTYVTAPPADRERVFVVERAGRIRVVRDGRTLSAPFLDIRGRVQTGGESGLLSMAFAPDYARSRRFYVYYVDNGGAIRIEAFKRARSTGDRALPSSRRLVIRQPHHNFNHKGGQLQFGPDRLLYAGFGDGGGSGDPDRNAQNLGRLLGKVLRIDPRPTRRRRYRIPRGNPLVHRHGARHEIYAYGLRNPYRFSFDRAKGHLTIGDVGQARVEEIDFVPNRHGRRRAPHGGYNFGWSVFEGRSRFRPGRAAGQRPPVIQHTHGAGYCSIIGGYVIRDRSLGRGLYGRYLYGDLCRPELRIARLRSGGVRSDRALGPRVGSLVSFGEDARGRLYAVSLSGSVYRLALR
jgi:glucose/arabinose dehydrogenase